MNNITKRELEEQAILAFNAAVSAEFISPYCSAKQIEDNAYEILEFMPDFEELTDEEYDYTVSILLSQIC